MHIKDLCKQAHKIAIEKGFWDCNECEDEPQATNCNGCIKKRNKKGKAKRNIPELLMLIVSELGEACEALRNNSRQIRSKSEKWKKSDGWLKDSFEDEIADVFIRLADMCEALGIDIEWQIEQKMSFNKTRPIKHGKEF